MDDLRSPSTDAEWLAYHAIRRHVLFELRGRGDDYDPNRPDERRPGHFPLILWRGNEPVGVIRVDIDGDRASFRRVAVRADVQRRGYGRSMLLAAEQFARRHGCTRIESNVDPGAVGSYERCGFRSASNDRPDVGTVLMTKAVTGAP